MLKQQADAVAAKKMELEIREERRMAMMEAQKLEKMRENERLRKEKEEKLAAARENFDRMLQEKMDNYNTRQKINEEKSEAHRQSEQRKLEKKRETDNLKRQDRMENVMRMAKQQEFQRKLIMEKIQDENERVAQLQRAKEMLKEERKKRREEINEKKKKLLADLENLKKGKGNLQEYASMYLDGEFSGSLEGEPSKQTPSRTQPIKSQEKKQSTQPKTDANFTSPRQTKPKPALGNKSTNNFGGQKVNQPYASPQKNSSSSKGKDPRVKLLEDMRNKHASEMKRLLDQEEQAELNREQSLTACSTDDERAELDKKFGVERAQASDRIVKLSEKHRKAENKLGRRLGLEIVREPTS